MYENNLRTGTGYEYNSNLENMVIKKAEPQEQKVDFKVLEALLGQGKEIYELSNERLLELEKKYKEQLNNLPQKNLSYKEQSPLEKEVR